MKIAHIFSNYKIGGAQTLLVDIMNSQCNENDVTLFIITDIYEQSLLDTLDKRVKVIKLNRKVGSLNYWPYIKLNLMINLSGYDIIHTHENHIDNKLFFFHKVSRFHTIHTTGEYALNKSYLKFDGVFAISQAVYDVAERFLGTNKNLILANNGITPKRIVKRQAHALNKDKILIGCVSRLIHEIKGQDLIIEALHILDINKKLPSNLKVEFIGDGLSMDFLNKITTAYKLNSYVSFLGAKDRGFIYNRLKDYDLFIQPSRFEGFALTVVEAMAAKVPVLVSNYQGPFEIIAKGLYGEWFVNDNANELAKKILHIINNYDEAISKANLGYQIAVTKYNIEQTAKIYVDNYKVKLHRI